MAGTRAALLALLCLTCHPASAEQVKERFINVAPDGSLSYRADEYGNRIPDFSSAGYGGGGVPLPQPVVRAVVPPGEGDDGQRIQAALDHVATLEPQADGFRGAVYLPPGEYRVAGQLCVSADGVVLRGAGSGEHGTVIVATGHGRRTLIVAAGRGQPEITGPVGAVAAYVPVGAQRLPVVGGGVWSRGTRVLIEHRPNAHWLETLGMHVAPARTPYRWSPDDVVLRWERTIVGGSEGELALDAPLTSALDARYGETTVARLQWPERLRNVGIEHLRLVSEFSATNPKDEEHAWMAVELDAVEDAWVADVVAKHFVSSAVHLGAGTRAVTVQDCASLAPVSELGGYRRHSFHTRGQLTLFQRCVAEDGRNDFTVGHAATGPNVFLECMAIRSSGLSGSIGSWASGTLFDNVDIDGGALALDNLETWNGGVGWAAANSVLWQCSASILINRQPPTAQNWAVGVWGQFVGNGWWDQVDEFVQPESLYRAQLAERRGPAALAALAPVAAPTAPVRPEWAALQVPPASSPRLAEVPEVNPLALRNGWLVNARTGALVAGSEMEITWWRGHLSPARAEKLGPNLTRFAPGHHGRGLTDDLEALSAAMRAQGAVSLRHHYGLWYDRRRDDHQRMRRATADVWPPFYEQPWARSGQGEAADRLSRYDLTRYNPWYFGRLREFAELGRRDGLVLVNEMYFQHNILESGAHWVDSPWRPINALQPTGFPEPPPFTGDTVKVADWFYDVSHPVRRELHRAYIRQCLANLADQPNVIHTTSAEYSGPLHFVQFWLDVVAEWQAETGHDPLIALSAPKDVQDAILADQERAAIVDVIDFTYWWRTDNDLYAPKGGENLAPRQHLRKWKGGPATATSLAGMVQEYRDRFPGKAIITGLNQPDPWVFLAAGGSLPALPQTSNRELLEAVGKMQPAPSARDRQWVLRGGGEQLVVALGREPVVVELPLGSGSCTVRRIDAATGEISASETIEATGRRTFPAAPLGTTILWMSREAGSREQGAGGKEQND